MLVTYGIDAVEADDKFFHMAEGIAMATATISSPGRFPVEAVPSLQYLPTWLPGGRFKDYAANMREYISATQDKLYETTIDGLVSSSSYTQWYKVYSSPALRM